MDIVKAHLPVGYCNHQIVHAGIIGYVERTSAAVYQNFNQKPCRALVAINKAVVSDHAVQQRGGFS